jgi:hypothetical protein
MMLCDEDTLENGPALCGSAKPRAETDPTPALCQAFFWARLGRQISRPAWPGETDQAGGQMNIRGSRGHLAHGTIGVQTPAGLGPSPLITRPGLLLGLFCVVHYTFL